jgi:hypothetical protein
VETSAAVAVSRQREKERGKKGNKARRTLDSRKPNLGAVFDLSGFVSAMVVHTNANFVETRAAVV